MLIAIAVLLFVVGGCVWVASYALVSEDRDPQQGLFVGLVAIATIVLGVLQLTVPVAGVHIAISVWLCVIGIVIGWVCVLGAKTRDGVEWITTLCTCLSLASILAGIAQFIVVA